MPRNGSGVYNLPTGINPVSPNTPITSTWANTTLEDIASALSQSLARDGQTTPIANLPMGGFRHTNVSNPSARNQYATLGWVQDGFHIRATSVGGTNAISAQLLGGATALQTGQMIQLTPVSTNTGAVTLDINSIGAKQVVRINGLQFASGEFVAGTPYVLIYDGTKFICLNAPVDSGSAPATIGPSTGNTVSGGTHTHSLDLAADYTWTGNHTFNGTLSGNLSGNAATATTADSATTATTATRLATARNFTIGGTSRSFNGSANVSWSLSDIGAAPTSHTHEISQVTGLQSTLNGLVTLASDQTITGTKTFAGPTTSDDSAVVIGRGASGAIGTAAYLDIQTRASSENNDPTEPQRLLRLGWWEGAQNLGIGEGVGISFYCKLTGSEDPTELASIVTSKTSSGDTDSATDLLYNTTGEHWFGQRVNMASDLVVAGVISDSIGDLRRTRHRTVTGNNNLQASALNCINEKSNNTAYTWTIPSGFGSPGDIITVLNTGSSGNVTVAAGSGVTMYRSGASVSSVVVSPGNCINFLRTSVSDRWQVMG